MKYFKRVHVLGGVIEIEYFYILYLYGVYMSVSLQVCLVAIDKLSGALCLANIYGNG